MTTLILIFVYFLCSSYLHLSRVVVVVDLASYFLYFSRWLVLADRVPRDSRREHRVLFLDQDASSIRARRRLSSRGWIRRCSKKKKECTDPWFQKKCISLKSFAFSDCIWTWPTKHWLFYSNVIDFQISQTSSIF